MIYSLFFLCKWQNSGQHQQLSDCILENYSFYTSKEIQIMTIFNFENGNFAHKKTKIGYENRNLKTWKTINIQ